MCTANLLYRLISFVLSFELLVTPFDGFIQKLYERFFESGQASSQVIQADIVYEAVTGTVISSENEHEVYPAGHFAKLMTLLIVQEDIESGKLSNDTSVTVSEYANSMQDPQIWLDKGEKISVEELVKAIIIGNANDACAALAETCEKTETAFVERMNAKAEALGMEDTVYADCTGVSEETITSAYDTAVLCAELSKHDELFGYMTTWIDNVRGGKTQLVNLNRLIRSYKGIIGIKACYSQGAGNCLAAAAQRDGMTVVAVMIGSPDEDSRFSWARDAMNTAFAAHEVYVPEMKDGILDDVAVTLGSKPFAAVDYSDKSAVLIPKGSSSKIKVTAERIDSVPAPVKEGDIIGNVVFTLNGEEIFTTDIFVAESVNKLTAIEAFKRLLLELLNL